MGGASKLAPVTAIRQKLTSFRNTPQGEIPVEVEQIVVFPDRIHMSAQVPGLGEMTRVVTPTVGFIQASGSGISDLPAPVRRENVLSIQRDLVNVAQHASDPKYIFASQGTEKIGNGDAAVLDIVAGRLDLRWYVNPASGQVRP